MNYLYPEWPAPPQVKALVACRRGSVSSSITGSLEGSASAESAYGAFNLADHVGDDTSVVMANRQQLLEDCAGLESIQWLQQVHGTGVIDAERQMIAPAADACFSRAAGRGCAVLTADCLPVIFCDIDGRQVAAAHAGWRGLVTGILECTLDTFFIGGDRIANEEILAWLGPAISQPNFEVGPEVREQFLKKTALKYRELIEQAFTDSPRQRGHYLADLYQLARSRLQIAGVQTISGGNHCTFAEADNFYSYRRDKVTGRIATLVYLQSQSPT